MPRNQSTHVRERVLVFAASDVPYGAMYVKIGMALGELAPHEWLRIHIFSRANNNGDEITTGPYVRERVEHALQFVIDRDKLPMRVKWIGSDILVGRTK
jgi:hypothetical protein